MLISVSYLTGSLFYSQIAIVLNSVVTKRISVITLWTFCFTFMFLLRELLFFEHFYALSLFFLLMFYKKLLNNCILYNCVCVCVCIYTYIYVYLCIYVLLNNVHWNKIHVFNTIGPSIRNWVDLRSVNWILSNSVFISVLGSFFRNVNPYAFGGASSIRYIWT